MSRDQPPKAPRYNEPRPLQTTNVASQQSRDVTSDIVIHKVRQDESKPPLPAAGITTGVSVEQKSSQKRTPTTSKDSTQTTQREDSNTALSQKKTEQSKQENKIGDLDRSRTIANDDTTKSQTSSTPQLKILRSLPRKSPEKPVRIKRKQKTALPTGKTSHPVTRESAPVRPVATEVRATPTKPVPIQPSITQPVQSEQPKPKQSPVQSTPVSTNKIKADMFAVSVKGGDPVKSSPVKVQCKPRRQTLWLRYYCASENIFILIRIKRRYRENPKKRGTQEIPIQ